MRSDWEFMDKRRSLMKAKQALVWVKKCGIAVESARASVPSLAHAIAGEPIRGSWWAHPKGKDIFALSRAIRRSPDVLVCRLVDGKITYVHRRLWPALVRLAGRFPRARLAALTEVHTAAGTSGSCHQVSRVGAKASAERREPTTAAGSPFAVVHRGIRH